MTRFNKISTYQYLMNNIEVFFDYLHFIEDNPDFKNTNSIPVFLYEDSLYKHIQKEPRSLERENLKIVLGIENLVDHSIFSYGARAYNVENLTISNHFMEILLNIFQEFSKPLTKTEFERYFILLREDRIFFETSSLHKSQELLERIDSTEKTLKEATESILGSLNALKHKQSRLNDLFNTKKDVEHLKAKYIETKNLNDKYIRPLYQFTSEKQSKFIQELNLLRKFFDKENKPFLYDFKRKLDFYRKKYLFLIQEVIPIRDYISNYLKEGEIYLKRSLGNEILFNQLVDLIDLHSTGKNRGEKSIFSMDKIELKKIDTYFKNSTKKNYKDETLKSIVVNESSCENCLLQIKEILGQKTLLIKTRLIKNKIDKEKQQRIYNNVLRQKKISNLSNIFKLEVQQAVSECDNFNLSMFVTQFLEDSDLDWTWGDFNYLISDLIKRKGKNIKNSSFILFNKKFVQSKQKEFVIDNKVVKYHDIIVEN